MNPAVSSSPFSPYEEHLASNAPTPVGLLAFASPEKVDEAKKLFQAQPQIAKQALDRLMIYTRDLGDHQAVFATFDTEPRHLPAASQLLREQLPGFRQIEELLSPHPLAADGEAWLRLEWVNRVATDAAFPHTGSAVQHLGFVAGLKPESEGIYRTLHNANWPAVAEAMAAANYRNWTSHLVEVGEALYLFTDVQYIGTDIDRDNQRMADDPVTRRWHRLTEPCLIDLHGQGNWSPMLTLYSST